MTADIERGEAQAQQIMDRLTARQTAINSLVSVADKICCKLEHPTASVNILDQEELRAAINAVRGS